MEKIKVFIWTLLNLPRFRYRYWLTRKDRSILKILTSIETVDYILDSNCSVSRFGDGELQMIGHYLKKGIVKDFNVDTFQDYDETLARRLLEVFQSNSANNLICLPYQFRQSSISKTKARVFWEREWLARKQDLESLGLGKQFGDTNFTRFYLHRKDIKEYVYYIEKIKQIWADRDIIVVEGQFSRLGVGNDFFDKATTVERIICPAVNAFRRYDELLMTVKRIEKNKLILIALGHTATVLAYDLSVLGYQAIDVGHVDIEYEWYKMGVMKKVAVPGKYVNEVSAGRIKETMPDKVYESQIISHIA